jgi:uncharacterized protein (TIGR01777 family)
MRIVTAGGTGFLGQPLVAALAAAGHEVKVLSRRAAPAAANAGWTDRPGVLAARWSGHRSLEGWAHLVDGCDAVINLAGESIAAHRWTPAQKARLERSRAEATGALVDAIAAASRPPRVLVSSSAVGYYGSRGDERLIEASPPGDDFLGRLAARWEAAAERARSSRTRVVLVRTGIVLERDGGALASMLLPFRLGVGGPLGSGRQFMSWIHRDDWVALVAWLLARDEDGPFNATAPSPVTNAEFTRILAEALHRPAFLRAPAFALRLALGEMADPLLLSSQRVLPERALAAGFAFRYPELRPALDAILRASR